ncbi:glycosyltransferase [Acinetobacter qingfengensis]|uniref:Spore protein YkvP/CgeB glycosyl transferase-like domain-containing protein n=2 Tax=Acinetobacter qingfengensis TaxID=1262585 RepID=A0A1E7RD54_9GAMM|nr:glycosyltransferase [Acinetobacter qingfengensis]OEY97278.1 hypothetical protein BJI46_01545 [Acinetobacter qingfengensis]
MKVLSIANLSNYGEANTALHRHRALCKIYPNQVDEFDFKFKFRLINKIFRKIFLKGFNLSYTGTSLYNKKIIDKVQGNNYEIVWIDKGIFIKPSTLKYIKDNFPSILIIGYSPDEMTQRHNQSADFLASLEYYDAYITTKSYAIQNLKKLGAKRVYFVNNAFEPTFHFPRNITKLDIKLLGGDIGFIGTWEQERADSIVFLAEKGLNIRVWGGGKWLKYKGKYKNLIIEDKGLFSENYSKALVGFKINLCFLRKINFDQQTTRSIEIPASGGFMLAERTAEHLNLFEEDKEAVFFDSNEELYEQCLYYLNHENERESIRQAGYQKCLDAGYSNEATLARVLKEILKDHHAD